MMKGANAPIQRKTTRPRKDGKMSFASDRLEVSIAWYCNRKVTHLTRNSTHKAAIGSILLVDKNP